MPAVANGGGWGGGGTITGAAIVTITITSTTPQGGRLSGHEADPPEFTGTPDRKAGILLNFCFPWAQGEGEREAGNPYLALRRRLSDVEEKRPRARSPEPQAGLLDLAAPRACEVGVRALSRDSSVFLCR